MQSILMLQVQSQNPVGAIPGVIDVSPMGAANYTIPIEVAPGTQGVQPNLSIVYNSFGGMGLLGMKWNLAGLSAITRCGQTPYFNNNITAIEFTTTDRLALDGNRLLKLSNNSYWATGEEYATEMEDFTRIVSYGGTTGNPDYFKAYTDDGSVIEYGNTTNSKQTVATNKTLSWLINKVTDANGNYMTLSYKLSNDKEIWIDEINYTGNTSAGINTYAKVKFAYTTLPDTLGQNTCFVGGFGIPRTKLLKTITVSYQDTVVRKYQFDYNKGITGERTAHLREIVLFGEGKNPPQLNATTIEWGDKNANFIEKEIPYFTKGAYILTGDFNGDGYPDFVTYGIRKAPYPTYPGYGTGWYLYLYDSITDSYHEESSGSDNTERHTYLYAQDVNGDGKDELIVRYEEWTFNNRIRIFSLYDNHGPTKTKIGSDVFFESEDFFYYGDYGFNQVLFGDFEGNGKTNIMITTKGSVNNNGQWTSRKITIKKIEENEIVDLCAPFFIPNTNSYVIDYNGTGKKNIATKDEVYEYDGSNFTYKNSSGLSNSGYHFFGDLNGDEITDAVVFKNSKWNILTLKGDGSSETYELNSSLLNTKTSWNNIKPEYPILIGDINRDGKADIIQVVDSKLNILFSKGWMNGNYIFERIVIDVRGLRPPFDIVTYDDFNGLGKIDIIISTYNYYQRLEGIIYSYKDNDYEFVRKIEDGIEKKIEFNYKHKYFLAKSSYFLPDSTFKKYFLSLVDSLRISNGVGTSFSTWQYQYDNAKYSLPRRIFLGFEKYSCVNIQENRKNDFLFNVDVPIQILTPGTKTSFCGNIKTNTLACWTILVYLSPYRFAFNYHITTEQDMISNIRISRTNTLNPEGRLKTSNTKTYNSYSNTDLLHSETETYTYQTITISGNQKKTVPTQILTTQQYGSSSTIIADTLSYGYTGKGRVSWMRKGNLDGVITTKYNTYTPSGLFGQKTIIAGNKSRAETYTYDATQRFVTQITNPLGHINQYSYDAKTGNKTKEIDPNGLSTTYKYDAFGNLTQINYPDKTQTTVSVDWHTASTPPNAKYFTKTSSTGKGDVTIYYDLLGREVCRLEDGYFFETVYNNKGQVEKISGPYNATSINTIWHKYTYDMYGRKKSEVSPYTYLSYTYNGKTIYVTDSLRGIQLWKDYDALGRIINSHDFGGDINYNYTITNNSKHQTTISAVCVTTTILTDLWGNRLSITDPDAGLIQSTYNGFGELVAQIDARGDTTTYEYDKLGRITKKRFAAPGEKSQTLTYTYDVNVVSGKGIGKLFQIRIDEIVAETFYYDAYSRLYDHQKKIDGASYSQRYNYNKNGQLNTLTYPDGFAVKYKYSSTGKLSEIVRNDNDSLIYKVVKRNKFQAPSLCNYGNGISTSYFYNPNGLPTRLQTGNFTINDPTISDTIGGTIIIDEVVVISYYVDSTILNYRYGYDNRGLMTSRSESVVGYTELFQYDKLDRLTKITQNQGVPQTFTYQSNGNIDSYGTATYTYSSSKPHAVTSVANNPISCNNSTVTYNFFNQPTKITEGDKELKLFYGANQQRQKMEKSKNGNLENTRYYVSKYFEVEKKPDNDTIRFEHYIYGDNGVVAMLIANYAKPANDSLIIYDSIYHSHRGNIVYDNMFYIHTDHLGSYCAITDTEKNVVQRNYFDAWGNYINNSTFLSRGDSLFGGEPGLDTLIIVPLSFTLTRRGFTGHEHYPEFKIINMNGRLYDPVIARFFSPDKYVANSTFTQDFNRYTYCRNNPLKYTDPSGNKISGFDIFSFIMFPVFLPARILSEGFTFINDKMNGDKRYGGYFSPSYLAGQTAPGSLTPYNPVNSVPYGHPLYTSPGTFMTQSGRFDHFQYSLGADNELSDWIFHVFNEQEYVRKIGSKKLMWMSKRAAASGGVTTTMFGKFLVGTYVGKFEDVNVFETPVLGKWRPEGGYSGVTIPEHGIVVGLGVLENDNDMMKHEFGHILQYRKHGARAYWEVIGPESLWSANKHGKNGWNHNKFWTETYANYLARNYFGVQYMMDGKDYFHWNTDEYPAVNISPENLKRLLR